MADDMDRATELSELHRDQAVAAARAASVTPPVVTGTCNACCDEDVPVRQCGGMPRCTPCRAKWEKRRG